MASSALNKILLPYQRAWIEDASSKKIWLAARQVGKSFTLAMEAVVDALQAKSVNIILSASQRQSKEVMQKVYSHLRVMRAMTADEIAANETKEEVTLRNGSRIICLPASPDTVRGFSGNVFLDEFAFHRDAQEIWRAMYPTTTRSYKSRISSTPHGKSNLFYLLWSRGEADGFSRHRTDIYDAVAAGLPVKIEDLRAGILDTDSWAQEYECQFIDELTAWLTYEMIAACEDDGATQELPQAENTKGEYYLGVDIGRKKDLSVFWLWERVGDVFWTRMAKEMRGAPFAAQRDFLYGLLDSREVPIRRGCIDSTGIGAQLAEDAAIKYGSQCEAVLFTPKVKEDLAVTMRRRFEDRQVRIPIDRDIREDFHSVRKFVTPSGNIRFDADRTELGHADRFWAAALGLHACTNAAGPIEFEAAGLGSISKYKTLKHFLGF
ncbi:MAG: terminase family protein [Nitrospiraceae bacterium]|nr:terminase family protein [Nitrospiraceae bacterium]